MIWNSSTSVICLEILHWLDDCLYLFRDLFITCLYRQWSMDAMLFDDNNPKLKHVPSTISQRHGRGVHFPSGVVIYVRLRMEFPALQTFRELFLFTCNVRVITWVPFAWNDECTNNISCCHVCWANWVILTSSTFLSVTTVYLICLSHFH